MGPLWMLTTEASRDLAVVGVEETDHVVVAATSRVEVVQVLSGHGEPDDEDDSRKGDVHHDNVLYQLWEASFVWANWHVTKGAIFT